MIFDFFKKSERLYGFKLSEWDYLGFTTIYYTSDDGTRTAEGDVHFFVNKKDRSRRNYHLESNQLKRIAGHGWMTNAALWRAGEVADELGLVRTFPSKYTAGVKAAEGLEWSAEKKGWVRSVDKKTSGNVVTIDFKK